MRHHMLRMLSVAAAAAIGSTTVVGSRAVLSILAQEGEKQGGASPGEASPGGATMPQSQSQFGARHPYAWVSWVVVVWTVSSALVQVFVLNWCLASFDAMFVIPLYVEESCVSIILYPVYTLYTPLLPHMHLCAPIIHVYTPYTHL